MPNLLPVSAFRRRISKQCQKALAEPVAHRFDFHRPCHPAGQSRENEYEREGSFVLELTGSDWHSFLPGKKATVSVIISSRLQNTHPVAVPECIVRQLDTYYKGGNGSSDKVQQPPALHLHQAMTIITESRERSQDRSAVSATREVFARRQ